MGCCGGKQAARPQHQQQSSIDFSDAVGLVSRALNASKPRDQKLVKFSSNWEVTADQIDPEMSLLLAEGLFGPVYQSRLLSHDNEHDTRSVIVKKLTSSSDNSAKMEFLLEIQAMSELDHENIIKLVGVVTAQAPFLMIFECNATVNFKTYLVSARTSAKLSLATQAGICSGIASALCYLSERNAVHGDIATRNCVIEDSKRVKLGDFGLSQLLFAADYHQLGDGPKKPLRWLAPEVLSGASPSPSSDVWSFGVLIWEVVTLANMPYATRANSEVAAYVTTGGVPDIPQDCPPELVGVMKQCWEAKRPGIGAIAKSLVEVVQDIAAPVIETYIQTHNPIDNTEVQYHVAIPEEMAETGHPLEAKNNKQKDYVDVLTSEPLTASELARDDLWMEYDIGKGAFGVVTKGLLKLSTGARVPCAVKSLRAGASASDRQALIDEANLVAQFNHPNVVSIFGQVTVGDPLLVVFEYMENGSLLSYLEKLPEEPSLEHKLKFAIDVSRGMEYLSIKNYVHRDLATRNILVSDKLVCKVADFGLSRNLEDDTESFICEISRILYLQ